MGTTPNEEALSEARARFEEEWARKDGGHPPARGPRPPGDVVANVSKPRIRMKAPGVRVIGPYSWPPRGDAIPEDEADNAMKSTTKDE